MEIADHFSNELSWEQVIICLDLENFIIVEVEQIFSLQHWENITKYKVIKDKICFKSFNRYIKYPTKTRTVSYNTSLANLISWKSQRVLIFVRKSLRKILIYLYIIRLFKDELFKIAWSVLIGKLIIE